MFTTAKPTPEQKEFLEKSRKKDRQHNLGCGMVVGLFQAVPAGIYILARVPNFDTEQPVNQLLAYMTLVCFPFGWLAFFAPIVQWFRTRDFRRDESEIRLFRGVIVKAERAVDSDGDVQPDQRIYLQAEKKPPRFSSRWRAGNWFGRRLSIPLEIWEKLPERFDGECEFFQHSGTVYRIDNQILPCDYQPLQFSAGCLFKLTALAAFVSYTLFVNSAVGVGVLVIGMCVWLGWELTKGIWQKDLVPGDWVIPIPLVVVLFIAASGPVSLLIHHGALKANHASTVFFPLKTIQNTTAIHWYLERWSSEKAYGEFCDANTARCDKLFRKSPFDPEDWRREATTTSGD